MTKASCIHCMIKVCHHYYTVFSSSPSALPLPLPLLALSLSLSLCSPSPSPSPADMTTLQAQVLSLTKEKQEVAKLLETTDSKLKTLTEFFEEQSKNLHR